MKKLIISVIFLSIFFVNKSFATSYILELKNGEIFQEQEIKKVIIINNKVKKIELINNEIIQSNEIKNLLIKNSFFLENEIIINAKSSGEFSGG